MGAALNLAGVLTFVALLVLSTTVTSDGGTTLPMLLLAAPFAAALAVRFGGCLVAIAQGKRGMPWGARIASWVLAGIPTAMLGLAGASAAVFVFGAVVALDAMTGFVKRDEVTPREKPDARGWWRRVRIPLLVTSYLGLVVAFHVFVGRYLPYGVLITWTLLALGFAVAVRAMLVGPKAIEAWLQPPPEHRLHERRERAVADPQREKADAVLHSFRARGDAGPMLALIREAARAADLRSDEVQRLESRILASFARAGTNRDEDVAAALDEVESFLSLRIRPQETRRP